MTLPLSTVQTSLVLSVYLTISLSVERYISVLHPLVSIRLHSGSSCLPLALPAVISSIIFTLPTYFMLDTSCEQVKQLVNKSIFQGLSKQRPHIIYSGY